MVSRKIKIACIFTIFKKKFLTYCAHTVDHEASSHSLFMVEAVLTGDNKPSVAVGT